jgi:hypothetical protein
MLSKIPLSTANSEHTDREPYCVDDGLHSRPRCTKVPEGPQPTRNDRPNARPASTKASSTPFTMEAELSTLAYLREGRKGTGPTSWEKEALWDTKNCEGVFRD